MHEPRGHIIYLRVTSPDGHYPECINIVFVNDFVECVECGICVPPTSTYLNSKEDMVRLKKYAATRHGIAAHCRSDFELSDHELN